MAAAESLGVGQQTSPVESSGEVPRVTDELPQISTSESAHLVTPNPREMGPHPITESNKSVVDDGGFIGEYLCFIDAAFYHECV